MAYVLPPHITKPLEDVGLVPPNAAHIELVIPPDGLMRLRYEILVRTEQLAALAAAFTDMAQRSRIANDPRR